MDRRICSRCGEDKPLEDYYKQQLAKRAPYCKDCRKTAMAARRARGRERRKEREAEQRGRINAVKLTLKCVDCGWSPTTNRECSRLHFNYIDPATKTHRAAFRTSWPWDRIVAEMALCVPRCNSCHAVRTGRQRRGQDPYPIPWSSTRADPPPPVSGNLEPLTEPQPVTENRPSPLSGAFLRPCTDLGDHSAHDWVSDDVIREGRPARAWWCPGADPIQAPSTPPPPTAPGSARGHGSRASSVTRWLRART